MESSTKKRLIRKMTVIAAVIFVAAGVEALGSLLWGVRQAAQRKQQEEREKQELKGRARQTLAEFAQRIVRLPVDGAVIGDVESKYFEQVERMRMFVWAMGAKGDFLFGVPAEGFARLNAAYDRNLALIQRDGRFANRQEFLRELIQSNDKLDFSPPVQVTAEQGAEAEPGEEAEWRTYRDDDPEHYVFSAPLKGQGGEVLGSLYLKVVTPPRERRERPGEEPEIAATGGAVVMSLAGIFLWFLLPTWVYVDARERGVRRAMLWSVLVLISFLIGWLVYLIARPEQAAVLKCPSCDREVNSGGFCPYCGRDLSTAYCAACRYPLKPDWTFCPSCRAEIKPQAPAAPKEPA
jgi:hypothetical protein